MLGDSLDRRIIYLFVLIALSVPLAMKLSVPPAKMQAADRMYQIVEDAVFQPGDIAFVTLDFGPSTKAENEPQSKVAIEHLMRKRIPFVLFSQIPYAEPFMKSIPEGVAEQLEKEFPGKSWDYGKDWVNLGFRQGGSLLLQSLPKEPDLKAFFATDVNGTALDNFSMLDGFSKFSQIKFLYNFTGSVGVFDRYLEFFSSKDYRPIFLHGCTSITIPEAYIYIDSGQLQGLLEGLAGAAWYSSLLQKVNLNREVDDALIVNTGLGVAQLVIIFLILLGNILYFVGRK